MNSKNSSLKERIKKGLFEIHYTPKIKAEANSFEFVFGQNKDSSIQNSFNNPFSDFFNFSNKGSFNFNSSFNEKKNQAKNAVNNNQSFTFSHNSSNIEKLTADKLKGNESQKISNSTVTKSSDYIKAHEEYFDDQKSESDKENTISKKKLEVKGEADKQLNSSLRIIYKGNVINKDATSFSNNFHLLKNGSSFKEKKISKSDISNLENSFQDSKNLLNMSPSYKNDLIFINSNNNSFSLNKGLKIPEPLNLDNSDVFYNNLLMKNKKSESNVKKVDSSVKEEFNNLFKKNDNEIKVPPLTSDSNTSKASNYKFVQKLIEILSNNSLKKIVKWSEDGNNIEILNQREFTDKVLPLYFKHNNYSNFIRQLNMYHFKKVKNQDPKDNAISYSNDFFKRNSTHLVGEIHRKQQYGNCGASYIDKDDKSVNNEHFTNKLNTLFNKIFELEEKVKQLNNVNDTIISNNMNFIEDIKDKSYYIGVLENVIFYIVNNFLSNNNNITINNSYSNFDNINENNLKALAPGDSNEILSKNFCENLPKSSNSSLLNFNNNSLNEEMKLFKNDDKSDKFLSILEKESSILDCTCGGIKSERKNSNNSILSCHSNILFSNNRENEIKKSIIIIKEDVSDEIKSCNSKQVNNVNVNYEYQDEGISSLGSKNKKKSNDFFSNDKLDKNEEKEIFQNLPENDPRKKYVDLINKLKKEKYDLENEINEKKGKQFCKKCFVNELKNKIKLKIGNEQNYQLDSNDEKNFDTPITDNSNNKKLSENNPEGAFKHLLNRFKEYSSKKNVNLIANNAFAKKLHQFTRHENNFKDTPDFNFYNGEKLNLKENTSPNKSNPTNNFTKFTRRTVENLQNTSNIDDINNGPKLNFENIVSDNKSGINSNLELSDKLSGRKRTKK